VEKSIFMKLVFDHTSDLTEQNEVTLLALSTAPNKFCTWGWILKPQSESLSPPLLILYLMLS